jgi:hypothetical protein
MVVNLQLSEWENNVHSFHYIEQSCIWRQMSRIEICSLIFLLLWVLTFLKLTSICCLETYQSCCLVLLGTYWVTIGSSTSRSPWKSSWTLWCIQLHISYMNVEKSKSLLNQMSTLAPRGPLVVGVRPSFPAGPWSRGIENKSELKISKVYHFSVYNFGKY